MDKLTLEIKSVKAKIPVEGLTFDAIEQMIFDITREAGRTVMAELLRQYDMILRDSRPRGQLKNIRTKSKYLQTRIGDVLYSRTLYKEKATGKARYLLDEALGIDKNQRMSLRLSEILGLLSSLGPYRGVKEQLTRLLEISWSHEAIRQNVIREGKRIEAREAKEHKKIKALDYSAPQEVPDVVYNEADATYIRRQNKGIKKAHKKRHFEVKLGIGYTGKETRYVGGRHKGKKLIRRIVYADIKADRNEFLDRFSCIGEKVFGLSAVKTSYFGGDGDHWIREGKKEYFNRATYLLCPFHLFRNLRRALAGKKKIQQRLKKLFEKNQIDKVLASLLRMIRLIRNRKVKKNLAEFYGYVRSNRQGIEASMRVRMDKTIESAGAVEPNIDKLIAHRFKGRGMSWSEQGAQSLLKIRQTVMNGQWENWWYNERDKKIEVKAIFKEPLTAKDMIKRRPIAPFVEAQLPCYRGPDQGKPWVGILHQLCRARQLS